MPAYEYVAIAKNGKEQQGTREGDSAKAIRQWLRESELIPVSVTPVASGGSNDKSSSGGKARMGALELAMVTRQLATLLDAGLQLEESLQAIARQSEKANIRKIMVAVRAKVIEGHTFASALDDFPRVFPDLYRATVMAGEQSGHLPEVLSRLADYTESRHAMKQKTTQALIYPILLIVVAIGIVVGLLIFVVPQVIDAFADTGQKLPMLTQVMIGASEFLQKNGFLLLVVIVGAILLFRFMLRNDGFRASWHHFLLRLPMIGRLIRGSNTARFTRTLSILSSSGVSVLKSFDIAARVVDNLPMKKAVDEAAEKVRTGRSISRSMEESKMFPPMAMQLIASGEASGELDTMLERAADHQERELTAAITAFLSIFQPILILIMGVVVTLIVLAILQPIFEMNKMVR